MPVIARSPEGKVVSLWGTALIRGADGQLRQLKVGDIVRKGDQILTTQDGIVQIDGGEAPAHVADGKAPAAGDDVEQAISALNRGDSDAAPAAGLAGGGDGSMQEGLRVDRIAEGVSAGDVPRSTADAGSPAAAASLVDDGTRAGASGGTGGTVALSISVSAPPLTNNATPTITGTTSLSAGSTVTLVVTDSAGAVQTFTAVVRADGSFSAVVPAALAEGGYTVVGSITDASGNSASAIDGGLLDVTAPSITVDAPALASDPTPTITGTTNLPAGSTVGLVVTDASGVVQNFAATVAAGGNYSVNVPVALAEGTFTVVATATDAAGNSATANDAGAVDLTAPAVTVDAPALTNDATPTITGTTTLPAGSTISLLVTDSAGASQTVTVTVATGGTYSLDVPAALAEGNFTVVATATDAVGNSATANDAGAIDITAPSVTVNAPTLTNDSTPTITGTTNLPAGSTVSLVLTDANGAVLNFAATVVAGGTYSVDVPASLAGGNFNVVATATDAAGNSASANDAGAIDLTAPSVTVDAPALTNDATPAITGTTNLPAGSSVSLVVTDANGAVQNITATVAAGGTYSVDVPAAMAEGNFTVVATATDAAGNSATANDAGAIDLTAPSITVDAPSLTNDSTPTITGTTTLPAGSTISLVVTDANGVVQNLTATVAAGGTYSVDVPAAMAEGNFTVVATATDAAANSASANDVGAIDVTAPSVTVDAPALTNDATPTITGTTNLPAGSTVSLLVTDAAGASQTVSATVAAGGTYSVDVPAVLAEGAFTVAAAATDAAGNSATANDVGAIDLTAPSVTVDAPALTNDATPTISGTTNLPAGATVSLVVTDANGVVQNLTATVTAGGTYSVNVPAALAEGNFTVVVAATDAAGNSASANDAGAIDLTAPSITVDAPTLTNDSTPTITGTTNLPAGSTVGMVITDANGAVQVISATVAAGGTYSVDVPAVLAEGNFTVVATATDAAGNSATANDAGAIDLTAPSITVDAPSLTNDSTPTITGTTNLSAGSTVSLVVTDANGVVQNITATVAAGGTFSVDVPAALAEGAFTVVVTAIDAAGNSASANDAGAIDVTAPSVTVDAPALTNDATPTITGTTNLPAGSTISLLVTDAAGAAQTISATVAAGGTYSVDVPAALAEGNFTVVATATDAAGNSASANDAGAIDLTAPTITVDAPSLTNDATPTITGTTNLPAGSTVVLVVTDANGVVQNLTAAVTSGGTYSVDVPASLAEGNFTVVATATDAAGNSATANDAGAIDITAPSLTVDAPALTNDATPTITGTTDLPAGSTVSLVVTDTNGVVQNLTATVAAGGTYSVEVPAALAEGNFTVVATATDAAGNSATANDAGAIDITAPSITVDAPALTNDSTPTITGTTNLPAGSTVSLLVIDSTGASQLITATVAAGGTYSVDVSAAMAEGSYSVVATATDAAGNDAGATDTGVIDLTAPTITVAAPALTNDATPTITGTTNLPAGSTVGLVVTDANGVVQNLAVTVAAGGIYSVEVPAALAEGSFTVVATATDAAGNSASANDAGAIDLTAPSVTVDAPTLTNDATPTITGTTNLPAGSTVSLVVTDANGIVQTISATVAAGGTYSVDVPAALAEGAFTVVATATDAAGNSATANDAGAIDITAPSITVDAPALTNDATPTITGTTNVPAGSTVSLVVTDANGVAQNLTSTVAAGGTYSVEVPAALAEGNFTVVATANDAAGNSATANDAGVIDITAPSITVDAPALTNDATPTITGTTNLPAGSTVSLVVTDANGAVQNLAATVSAGGAYSVDVPAALAEGAFTVVATATDAAGNSATPNDAGAIDLTAPSITVDAPALTNDATPTITGTTDLPAGSTISLMVTDANGVAQNLTATVAAGGTYSVDVPAALAEGNFTVVATATDAAGNAATANDAGAIDLTAPTVTVDAPALTNDATPTITGTTNLPAGSTVALVVTDANGVAQNLTATVAAGGTYSVDVPAALAEGNFTVVATATDAAGNSASANDAGAVDVTAPSVTVDASALTNDATPTITGTTNLPKGSTVSLVVTDANGVVQTISATVAAGGTYSVDVPAALAEGNFTVVATATDAAGNAATANDAGAIDLTAPTVTLALDPVTADNVLSATEAGGNVVLSGIAGGDAVAGDIVVLAVNGQSYQATVGSGGSFSVSVPGSALAADADTRVDASITLTDAAGNSSTATATQLYSVNTPPAGADRTVSTAEDTAYQFTASDFGYTDANGQPLAAVRIDSLPAAGQLLLGGVPVVAGQSIAAADLATLSFVPAADANGSGYANFSFSVGDGIDFGAAPNQLTIDVTAANDAPVAQPDGFTVAEDAAVVNGAVTATDIDAGTTLTFALVSPAPAGLTFNADGTYIFDPSAAAYQPLGVGQSTVITVPYTVTDDAGASSSANLVITVTGTNDAPVAVANTGSANENATLTATAATGVLANDTDIDTGDTRTVSAVSFGATIGSVGSALSGTYGTLTLEADGSYSYAASQSAAEALTDGQVVTESFSYTVRDNAGATSTTTLTFTITGANDTPTITGPLAGSVQEDTTLSSTGTLVITDADAGESAFQAQTGTPGTYGSFSITAAGVWTYTLANAAANVQALPSGAAPTETFTVVTADGTTRDITISVNGLNDAPVNTVPAAQTTAEDAPRVFSAANGNAITVADVDGGTLTVTVSVTNGTLAANAFPGATIGSNGSGSVTISGTAAAINAALDGLAYTPPADYNGAATLTVSTSDGIAPPVVSTVALTVTAVTDIANDTVTTNEDSAVTVNVIANDSFENAGRLITAVNGTAIAVGGSVAVGNGSVLLDAAGQLVFTPAADFNGSTSFTYTVTSGGVTETATASITVNPINDAPVNTVPGVQTTNEDSSRAITGLSIADVDAAGGTMTVTLAVTHGTLLVSGGTALVANSGTGTVTLTGTTAQINATLAANVTYVPTADFNGNATLTMTTSDGGNTGAGGTLTDVDTVSIVVNAVNDAPVAQPGAFTVAEDAAVVTGAVTATDVDAGDSLSFALNGAAPAGLTFNANGTYSFNPAVAAYQSLGVGQQQLITVPYTVTDSAGATSTANLAITVTGTNDAPVANANTVAATEDTALTISPAALLANDTDVDSGSTLSITSVQSPVNGTVALVGGSIVFTPTANHSGPASFTYTVSDGQGGSSTATVTVNVGAVADAPALSIGAAPGGGTPPSTAGLPAATGLVRAFYDNVATVGANNAGTIATVEANIEATAPTSTATVTDVSVPDIGVDDAYRYTGYIYLQAGQTYQINGSRDDTLMVKIGGTSVYSVGFNNWGAFSASGFTPSVSGFYSLEVIAYNGDGVGNLDINMSVNGGAALDLNTSNFRLYASPADFTGTPAVAGTLVPNNDGGYFPGSALGNEDSTIRLGTISAALADTDGSEALSLTIAGIPVGATISDGVNSFTATAGNTTATVTGWTLNNLSITPPANFSGNVALTVTATATEAAGPSASTVATMNVVVSPVADAPALAGETAIVAVGLLNTATVVSLPVMATLVDGDGSETLGVVVSGVPSGATLSAGTNTGTGTWTLTAAQLAGLTMTLPANYEPNTPPTLTITAVSTETATGQQASTSQTITVYAASTNQTTTGTNNGETLSPNNTDRYINALGGDDTVNAGSGDDLVRGGTGNDTIRGNNGNDALYGDAGNDILVGGAGNDLIVGGAGNDTLTGGTGTAGVTDTTTDVFAWSLADRGTAGAPAVDTITDFNVAAVSAGGDVLDLRDLLGGEALGAGNTAGNLANYLDFSVSGSGPTATTTIHISSNGQFAGGNYAAGAEDQTIVLQGVDLPSALGLGGGATDAQIVQELINRGKLIVDSVGT